MKQEHIYILSEKHALRVLDLTETLKGNVIKVSESTVPCSNKHAMIQSNAAVGEASAAL